MLKSDGSLVLEIGSEVQRPCFIKVHGQLSASSGTLDIFKAPIELPLHSHTQSPLSLCLLAFADLYRVLAKPQRGFTHYAKEYLVHQWDLFL